jgi:hypothetical protein
MRGEERNDEERAGWWPVRLWLDIIGSSGTCMYYMYPMCKNKYPAREGNTRISRPNRAQHIQR